MANQEFIIKFRGKLGDQIGVKRNKKYHLRKRPKTVNQSASTRRAARRFGMASSTGALIRHAFSVDTRDGTHINRLTKALIPSAGQHIRGLKGFRFNKGKSITTFLTYTISKDGKVHIPCTASPLAIKIMAARIDFDTRKLTGTDSLVTTSNEDITFIPQIPGNGTLIIILQVQHPHHNNKQMMAADIIAVQEQHVLQPFPPATGIPLSATATPILSFFPQRE